MSIQVVLSDYICCDYFLRPASILHVLDTPKSIVMLKILFISYLFALWFWTAWKQANQQSTSVGAAQEPFRSEPDPVHS